MLCQLSKDQFSQEFCKYEHPEGDYALKLNIFTFHIDLESEKVDGIS